MKVTSNNEQKVKVTLKPTTTAGNPAQVDGVPTWEVLSGDATVDVAEDGLSAYLVSADNTIGLSQVQVTADADTGEGVQNIQVLLEYEVTSPFATNLGVEVSEAEPK